jgi:hypothetical protein
MMFHKTVIVVSMFCLFAIGLGAKSQVLAQEDTGKIIYGDTVTGEITDREFEIEYLFDAEEGDLIVISMKGAEGADDMDYPSVILLNPDFDIVGSTYGYTETLYVSSIPSTGEYTILATRNDGRAGESLGEFELTLDKVEILSVDSPITAEIDNESTMYYGISDVGEFTIIYEKLEGDFFPYISINKINEGELDDIAYMTGEVLTMGMMRLDGEEEIYILMVTPPPYYYSSKPLTATYSLTLEEVD